MALGTSRAFAHLTTNSIRGDPARRRARQVRAGVRASRRARNPAEVCWTNSSSRRGSPRSSQVRVASTSQPKSASARQVSRQLVARSRAPSDGARRRPRWPAARGRRPRTRVRGTRAARAGRSAKGPPGPRSGGCVGRVHGGSAGPVRLLELLAEPVEDLLEDLPVEHLFGLEVPVDDELRDPACARRRRPSMCGRSRTRRMLAPRSWRMAVRRSGRVSNFVSTGIRRSVYPLVNGREPIGTGGVHRDGIAR